MLFDIYIYIYIYTSHSLYIYIYIHTYIVYIYIYIYMCIYIYIYYMCIYTYYEIDLGRKVAAAVRGPGPRPRCSPTIIWYDVILYHMILCCVMLYRCRINKHSSRCRLCFESFDPAPLISKFTQRYPAAANTNECLLSDRLHSHLPCPWTLTLGGKGWGRHSRRAAWVFIYPTPVWCIVYIYIYIYIYNQNAASEPRAAGCANTARHWGGGPFFAADGCVPDWTVRVTSRGEPLV